MSKHSDWPCTDKQRRSLTVAHPLNQSVSPHTIQLTVKFPNGQVFSLKWTTAERNNYCRKLCRGSHFWRTYIHRTSKWCHRLLTIRKTEMINFGNNLHYQVCFCLCVLKQVLGTIPAVHTLKSALSRCLLTVSVLGEGSQIIGMDPFFNAELDTTP